MTFNDDALKKSHNTQRKKYGKGYPAEMRRRSALRKTFGTGGGFRWLKEHDPERFQEIIDKREIDRRKRKNAKAIKSQEFLTSEDQAGYISALTQED